MKQSSKSNMHRRTKFPFSFSSSSPLILLLALIFVIRMAESVPSTADSSSTASVQIVYTERPQDEEPEAYHIRTLASVLGRYCTVWCCNSDLYRYLFIYALDFKGFFAVCVYSEDAAKEALLYSYKTAASGFSAKLTPQQVEQISSMHLCLSCFIEMIS